MTQEHPITPPPELTQEWSCDCPLTDPFSREFYVATQAARWGADQELEACVKWLGREIGSGWGLGAQLHAARRPKLPSLNSIALQMLGTIERDAHYLPEITDTIRRALEQLDD